MSRRPRIETVSTITRYGSNFRYGVCIDGFVVSGWRPTRSEAAATAALLIEIGATDVHELLDRLQAAPMSTPKYHERVLWLIHDIPCY